MSPPYWTLVGILAAICLTLTLAARQRPGDWTRIAAQVLGVILAIDWVTALVRPIAEHTFTVRASLPLSLCDIALVVAAFGCWFPDRELLVELTYFWGLAGSLQGVLTPDLTQRFPQLQFFVYTVGHMGIVTAAIFLVAGMRRYPRRRAVVRIWLLTLAYAAAVGVVDAVTGANYMFLAKKPATASLLSMLGPWPWYLLPAAAVSIVFLTLLDAPFWRIRRLAPV